MPVIYLIGMGLGSPETLTLEAHRALAVCDVFIGAPRLLEAGEKAREVFGSLINISKDPQIFAYVKPADILACIEAQPQASNIGVLLSGDIGFFSGAKALYPLLTQYTVKSICGISSLSYICAKGQIDWSDAFVISVHGRQSNWLGAVQSHEKTMILTGGMWKAEGICEELKRQGLGHLCVLAGENLSYSNERIVEGTARELSLLKFENLTVLVVKNPQPIGGEVSGSQDKRPWQINLSAGISDQSFCRGEVPMTKEEVRTLSLAKLGLKKDSILWDIGAGTGSVAVAAGLIASWGQVYAIEKDEKALSLLAQNKEKFAVSNVHIVPGKAPETLEALPAPDSVFIGGSGGYLKEILNIALLKNPKAHIVINAITLETVTAGFNIFKELNVLDLEVIEVTVTKAKKIGSYHMMQGQNPIFIISGKGQGVSKDDA